MNAGFPKIMTPMRKIFSYIAAIIFLVGIATTAQALTVSPAKIEITANPGQTLRGEIELFNEQKENKIFYSSYENFESRGDSGAPYFVGAENGLATWVTTDKTVSLAPGERIQVPYTINVPASAKPGGYFAAIFFGSQPAQGTEGGEVTIGGKIGVLVLLKVSGDVEESAGLVNFGAKDGRFFSALPIALEYGFNNTGGDRVIPRGEIRIKNTVQLESTTLLANDREGSVLPNSTRKFEAVWESNKEKNELGFFKTALLQITDFHLGWYRAELNLIWGDSAQTAHATHHFFIIPWQLLTILVTFFGALWFFFKVWLVRFKRRILAEAIKNNQ